MRTGIKKFGTAAALAMSSAVATAQEPGGRVEVVRVTGCLRRTADAWTLSGATDPVVITRATATAPPATAAEATVGSNEFKLIGIEEFDLASRKDRLVAVKGLSDQGDADEPAQHHVGDDRRGFVSRGAEEVSRGGTMTRTRISSRSLALALMLSAVPAAAQQPPAQPQTPRSQMPDLGRPTKSSDTLPLFNFEGYFLGKWTFEWDVPDSALGPAGTITGTTTYTKVDDTFYLATTEATGPGGPITIKETFGYKKDNKAIARAGHRQPRLRLHAGRDGRRRSRRLLQHLSGQRADDRRRQEHSTAPHTAPALAGQLQGRNANLRGRRSVHQLRHALVAQGFRHALTAAAGVRRRTRPPNH